MPEALTCAFNPEVCLHSEPPELCSAVHPRQRQITSATAWAAVREKYILEMPDALPPNSMYSKSGLDSKKPGQSGQWFNPTVV